MDRGPMICLVSTLASLLFGCTDQHESLDAGLSAVDAQLEPEPSVQASCKQRCAAARPDSGRVIYLDGNVRCEATTLDNCEAICASAVRDASTDCARCIVDGLAWPDVQGGCGSRECSCVGALPRFPSRSQCTASCDVAP
jgi:hypothetical protein